MPTYPQSTRPTPPDTILFAAVCTRHRAKSISGIAFSQIRVSLINPGMRSHQAVPSTGERQWGRFLYRKRLRATAACCAGQRDLRSPATREETSVRKFRLSQIAVMTCLAIVGLSACGCSQTTSEVKSDVSKPDHPALVLSPAISGSSMRGRRLSVPRPKQRRCRHRRPCRIAPHHTIGVACGARPLSLQEKRPTTMAAAEEELDGHPMPWRPAEKSAKSTPAPATTLPEPLPAPLQYQEESDGHPMPWRPASTPNGTRGAS
jgi:hypothetical protein